MHSGNPLGDLRNHAFNCQRRWCPVSLCRAPIILCLTAAGLLAGA
jgi:hypothetical protein